MWWHLVSAGIGLGIGVGLLKWRDRSVALVARRKDTEIGKLRRELDSAKELTQGYRESEIRKDAREEGRREARGDGMSEFEDAFHRNGRAKVSTTAGELAQWRAGR